MSAKTATGPVLEVPETHLPNKPILEVVPKADVAEKSVTTKYYLSIVADVLNCFMEGEGCQEYALSRGLEMKGLHESLLKATVAQPRNEKFKPYLTKELPGLIHHVSRYLQGGEVTLPVLASIRAQIRQVGI